MAHQVQIKELVNGIEITDNLDGVIVIKLLSYNSRPFFRTTNETDEESYQVLDTLGEIYHLPALANEFVLIDLQDNYWIPDNGTELIEYSYKIRCFRPDNENDKVLSIGEIETTSNSVTVNIPGVGLANTVRIDGTIYTNYYPSVFNYTPIVEFIKILIIYAKPDSTVFYLAQGEESSEAVEPPYDGLFVAKITVNLSGQIVDTNLGLPYIPITGTEEGKPVTGDIEFDKSVDGKKRLFTDNSFGGPVNSSEVTFEEDGTVYIKRNYGVKESIYQFTEQGLIISSNTITPWGIRALQDFTPNIGELDFTQKKYVDNPETLITVLTNADSTQLATIKGLLGIV